MTDYSVVITTINSEEEANHLARTLVESRLAACVSIIPNVTSVYNWKGELQRDREWLLLVKTRSDRTAALQEHFARHHPYEVPEFVVLPVREGSQAYLEWMAGWLGA
ncbi:MAG: divalent-cation tolerance protein CutA [Acidobacteria bacterium]|nr:divalent-cation tolerance protein CutA [Acidobacteriota bacterium]